MIGLTSISEDETVSSRIYELESLLEDKERELDGYRQAIRGNCDDGTGKDYDIIINQLNEQLHQKTIENEKLQLQLQENTETIENLQSELDNANVTLYVGREFELLEEKASLKSELTETLSKLDELKLRNETLNFQLQQKLKQIETLEKTKEINEAEIAEVSMCLCIRESYRSLLYSISIMRLPRHYEQPIVN
jgi:chromosome segregation ATPase